MATELEITWNGSAPGLQQHRLSIASFGPSLNNLLGAARRIATNLVSSALDEGEQESTTGRLANAAKQLDIEIAAIKEGSTGLATVLTFETPLAGTGLLFNDLPERVGIELVDALEQESKGTLRNSAIRKYLSSLPLGVSHQRYQLSNNGTRIRDVAFGEYRVAEVTELPALKELEGDIVGVGFEPGKNEVRIKGQSNTPTLSASAKQVNTAMELRGYPVRAIYVTDQRNKLLILKGRTQTRPQISTEDIERHLFQRWDGLLARLAR